MSENYTIHTFWVWRKSEELPELLEAWDDWSVDGNWEGWQEAKAKALESVRSDLGQWREVRLRIDLEAVSRSFQEPEIPAKVEGSS